MMAFTFVEIPVARLLFDQKNPRLPVAAASQQDAALSLTKVMKPKQLLALAGHIVKHGVDPLHPICVVPTGDEEKRYTVYEGNRRLLALKALDTPALVSAVLTQAELARLVRLSKSFQKMPVESLRAVLAESVDEVIEWLNLRHTGLSDGAGLSEWGPDEKERFRVRYLNAQRTEVGQVIDFLEREGLLKRLGEDGPAKFQSNLQRLLSTPEARQALGLDYRKGVVVALYPKDEVAKAVGHVVDLFITEKMAVKDIYHADDRKQFVKELPASVRPDPTRRLAAPVELDKVSMGVSGPAMPTLPAVPTKRHQKRADRPRTTVIPRDVDLDIDDPRLNKIYIELKGLNVEDFSNSAAVLLRVFLELNVDRYVDSNKLMTAKDVSNASLAKKLKSCADHLHSSGKIPDQLRKEMARMADNDAYFGASLFTFNQWVHNPFSMPKPSELYTSWDGVQPFVIQLTK